LILKRNISRPAWAHPRNLTGGDRRCRKDNRQKTKHAQSWGQVGWGLRWRQTAPSTSSKFIIYSCKTRWSSSSWRRGCDIILRNRRNLWLLLSECKHLRKNSCAVSCPLLQLGLCPTQPAVYLTYLCLCSPQKYKWAINTWRNVFHWGNAYHNYTEIPFDTPSQWLPLRK
jgi:hypothetical protein